MAKIKNILMVLGGGALVAAGIGKIVKDRKAAEELEEETEVEETEESDDETEVEETEE